MNWQRAYCETYKAVRGQLERERALGQPPRRARVAAGVDMRDFSDAEIDRYARREAERRTSEAINREIESRRQKGESLAGLVEEIWTDAAA